MKEIYRTIILAALIAFAIGFIIWLHTGYETRLLDLLR